VDDPEHLAKLAIVLMPAEIDSTNADRVGDELAAALTPGVWAVIADMTATTFCDPPAITMLVSAHLWATANNAELRLVTRSGAVLRALAIAMVDHSLPVYPSIAAALIPRPTPPALGWRTMTGQPAPKAWSMLSSVPTPATSRNTRPAWNASMCAVGTVQAGWLRRKKAGVQMRSRTGSPMAPIRLRGRTAGSGCPR
jgi:anti-anti-sigma factor